MFAFGHESKLLLFTVKNMIFLFRCCILENHNNERDNFDWARIERWKEMKKFSSMKAVTEYFFVVFFSSYSLAGEETRSSTSNVNELQHHFFTLKFFFGLSVFLVASFEIIFWFILYALFSLPVRLVQCNNIIIESCYSENSSQRAVCIRVMFQW